MSCRDSDREPGLIPYEVMKGYDMEDNIKEMYEKAKAAVIYLTRVCL